MIDDHFTDDEFVLCEGCGDHVALNIARIDEEGVWLCPGCFQCCVDEQVATRRGIIEGVAWAVLLGLLVALLAVALIRHLALAADPPRLDPGFHLTLQVPDDEPSPLGDLTSPGEFAATHPVQANLEASR